LILNIRVIPRAGRSGFAGKRGDALLFRLNAPPVDGAANEELIELLSDLFDIPKRNIAIVSGHRSRDKRIEIEGLTAEALAERVARG